MRGKTELVTLRKSYCLVAVLILISSFAGCAAGSCLSYGHSCWGAHGKRNGLNPGIADKRMTPSNLDERWLFSRMVNGQLTQAPLRARFRSRLLPELTIPAKSRISNIVENFSEDINGRDISRGESKVQEEISPDILLVPRQKDLNNNNDQAVKIGLYRILQDIDDKLK